MLDKKYILFDLDGTLTDSGEGILNTVKYALSFFGKENTDISILRKFIGPPLIDAFQNFTELSFDDATTAVAKYRERYKDIGIFENKVYEGIPELLQNLKNASKTLIVATSKPHIFANRILEYFDLAKYFSCVVGAEFDGTLNYKHEVIEEVLKRCKIKDKSQAIMIGDRHHDIDGAKQNGIESIGVLYGFAEPDELEKAGADYIAKSPLDIEKIIL